MQHRDAPAPAGAGRSVLPYGSSSLRAPRAGQEDTPAWGTLTSCRLVEGAVEGQPLALSLAEGVAVEPLRAMRRPHHHHLQLWPQTHRDALEAAGTLSTELGCPGSIRGQQCLQLAPHPLGQPRLGAQPAQRQLLGQLGPFSAQGHQRVVQLGCQPGLQHVQRTLPQGKEQLHPQCSGPRGQGARWGRGAVQGGQRPPRRGAGTARGPVQQGRAPAGQCPRKGGAEGIQVEQGRLRGRRGSGGQTVRESAPTPLSAPRTCSRGSVSQQPGSRAQRRSGGTGSGGAPSRQGCPRGCRSWNSSGPAGRSTR